MYFGCVSDTHLPPIAPNFRRKSSIYRVQPRKSVQVKLPPIDSSTSANQEQTSISRDFLTPSRFIIELSVIVLYS